jgi:cyclase
VLRKRIVVCLDVRDGEVVKGVQFKGLRKVGDPVELAARYQVEGADEVVFLDISASLEGRQTMLEVVRRTAERLFVPLTVGGGIQDVDDVGEALRAGADKISINTAAVQRPQLITASADRFGRQCVVASIDARLERSADSSILPSGYRVCTHGGSVDTDLDAIAWARECAARGAGEILLTAVHCDGERSGYDLALTRKVVDSVSVPVVASGGAGRVEHLRAVLVEARADAALVAGIFHDGHSSVAEVKRRLAEANVPVREVEDQQ